VDSNRQFRLRARPRDLIDSSTFELVEEAVPTPGPGQALVRNRVLSIDPSNRIWLRSQESYLPPVELGSVMRAFGIGQVVASEHKRYQDGDLVFGLLGWQDYALIGKGQLSFDAPVDQSLGVPIESMLGITLNGPTAYFGIEDVGRPKPDETVVVSAAAGATGSIAGQIAKLRGSRVVGIAGGPEKCSWLADELGFDAAVDRHAEDWQAQLDRACPDGIDVDFENVGGQILEAVLERVNLHSRVVLCGLLAEYNQDGMGTGPRNFELTLHRRVTIQGFILSDYLDRMREATAALGEWVAEGKLKQRIHVLEGLEAAPDAVNMLFTGDHIGKLVLRITDDGLQPL